MNSLTQKNLRRYSSRGRLYYNLKKRDADIDHFVWEFVKQHNAEVGVAILKLHGCPLNDESLSRSTLHESLFSNSYLRSLECLSGRRAESVVDVIDDQVCVMHMYDDENGMGIIRA